jgi:hypothetical protein
MARKRLIDTEELYFDTALVGILGDHGMHLYIRLWGLSEDWGGYEPKYADIALKMGALKFTPEEVEGFIKKLIGARKIAEYEVEGRRIHWLANLLKHQPLDNPAPPKLPLPEWIHCEIKQYKSGKKYAAYALIKEKLPVAYQSATSNGVTVTNSNSKETKGNIKAGPSEELKAALDKIAKDGLNIYALIEKTKKELKWGKDQWFQEEVMLKVCQAYWRDKGEIHHPWPWFKIVLKQESALFCATKNIEDHRKAKESPGMSLAEILKRAQGGTK